jgi:deoxyribonucleoside regulator
MDDESNGLLSLAAKLYYVDGLDQTQIAQIVGVSRSTVSRLLSRARETGIVRISVAGYRPRNETLEEQLKDRFGLRHAIVVRTFPGGTMAHTRHTTGYVAAPFAAGLIRPGSVVGVAGSRALADLVRYMVPAREVKGITVVQLMGNIGPDVSHIDAVELSHLLAHHFRGTLFTINAPALVAGRQARDLLLAHDHVCSVWKLFERMELAFVGIGSLTNSAFVERGVLQPADLERLRVQGAVGEICGRFFDARGQECTTEYRERVISIGLDELKQVQEVIGVTSGESRADALRAALAGGLLHSLIVDEAGAEALLARVAER